MHINLKVEKQLSGLSIGQEAKPITHYAKKKVISIKFIAGMKKHQI